MEDRIERLFQEWHQLGGAVLLARADPRMDSRPAEEVIAESTAHCRESGRLTWVVLDWMIRHIGAINEEELLPKTKESGNLAVLGLLCDAARERQPDPKFDKLVAACSPGAELEPFFLRVAHSPLALRLTQEHPLEIFRRWNFLCNELRYLSDPSGTSREETTST